MTALTGLQCHVCHTPFPAEALFVCDQCFGPLEAGLRLRRSPSARSRAQRSRRGRATCGAIASCCRSPASPRTGFTRASRRWSAPTASPPGSASSELYVKDDGVNHPTLSYKDRVVSVAATRAIELGFTVFGCASTGNLANSVAAHAARLGLDVLRLHSRQSRAGQGHRLGHLSAAQSMAIRGNYDDVNRLCTQIADKYRWGFANINLRSYYAEGAKTFGFEIAEQLGWRFPQHVVSPVAGGTLLPRIARAFRELRDGRPRRRRAAEDLRGAGRRLRAGRPGAARTASIIPIR